MGFEGIEKRQAAAQVCRFNGGSVLRCRQGASSQHLCDVAWTAMQIGKSDPGEKPSSGGALQFGRER